MVSGVFFNNSIHDNNVIRDFKILTISVSDHGSCFEDLGSFRYHVRPG